MKGMHALCLLLLLFSADISTVICDKADKAQVLLGNVERSETPGLRRIILMDTFDGSLLELAQSCGVHLQAMAEVEVGDLHLIVSTPLGTQIFCMLFRCKFP